MRIVVGSGRSRDLRQSDLDWHLAVLAQFIERVESDGRDPRCLTMILRSAASSAGQALIGVSPDLLRCGITAKVVVARLEPEGNLRKLFATLSELSPRSLTKDLIRWARNPRLLDAHEQVTYGASMCWSGDAMRREPDKRNALSLFEDGATGTVRLGHLAFKALWSAATVVAERRLSGPATPRPSGAYEPEPESHVAAVSAFRASPKGWPLVRH